MELATPNVEKWSQHNFMSSAKVPSLGEVHCPPLANGSDCRSLFLGWGRQLDFIGPEFNILTFSHRLPMPRASLTARFLIPRFFRSSAASLILPIYSFSFVFTITVHQALLPNPASSGYQTLVGVQQSAAGGQPSNMANQVQGVMVQYPPLQSYQVQLTKRI